MVVVEEKSNVTFSYTSLDDENKVVENLFVDRIWTSNDGHRIVQGWLHESGEGRAYRMERMADVVKVADVKDEA